MFFSFRSREDLSYDQLRKITINVSCELLARVNNNLKIRPYLANFPLDESQITVQVSARNNKMKSNSNIEIRSCSAQKGILYFEETASLQENFKKLSKETFTEALKKCHMTHPNSELLTENANPDNKQNIQINTL